MRKNLPSPRFQALFHERRVQFHFQIERLLKHKDDFAKISPLRANPVEPYWNNEWIEPLDAATLYSMLAHENPSLYVEIGSGNSTKFARKSISDHQLRTQIFSIDPQPRAEVDSICERNLRIPVEEMDPAFFECLKSGDILFIDSSHQVFQNSDVVFLFMEVIPALAKGVIVHVHDIFWPFDYPEAFKNFHFNEQYLLGAMLLAEASRYSSMQANAYISKIDEFKMKCRSLGPPFETSRALESSFWFQVA